jgi:hypothetical protein
MKRRSHLHVLAALVLCLAPGAIRAETMVLAAPGHPGTTEEAQPVLDRLARALERAMSREGRSLSVVYHPTADGGTAAIERSDAAIALVTLPFFVEHGDELGLAPFLGVVPAAGADERWTLVAQRGRVKSPESLAGWTVAGRAGHAPEFVRVAFGDWGVLPADTKVQFSPRVLTVLRAAARGEQVAAILDAAETEALASLDFASDLEVVARSSPLPASLACRVGDRLDDEPARAWREALLALDDGETGAEILAEMRLVRFEELDRDALAAIEKARPRP